MIETEGSARFATLDGEKYGKNSALSSMDMTLTHKECH